MIICFISVFLKTYKKYICKILFYYKILFYTLPSFYSKLFKFCFIPALFLISLSRLGYECFQIPAYSVWEFTSSNVSFLGHHPDYASTLQLNFRGMFSYCVIIWLLILEDCFIFVFSRFILDVFNLYCLAVKSRMYAA